MVSVQQDGSDRGLVKLRQCSVISPDLIGDLVRSGQLDVEYENTVFLVISHDCDISQGVDKEPYVECIQGYVRNDKPSHQYGKDSRYLHLSVSVDGKLGFYIELSPVKKICISKKLLYGAVQCMSYEFQPNSCQLLQGWLAARYKRQAFPDSLTPRLAKIQRSIEDLGRKTDNTEGVVAIYLLIEPPEEELVDEEPYEVSFRVVYDPFELNGEFNADRLVEKIKSAVQRSQASGINLDISEDSISKTINSEFTLKDASTWKEWRFEHLSFRGDVVGLTSPI